MRSYTIPALVACFLVLASLAWAAQVLMSVQVKEGHVRQNPIFLSPVVTTLDYGDQVSVLEIQDVWHKISLQTGQEGWMHSSALTSKVIVLEASAKDVQAAASGEELALAGKGFNKQVEEEFQAANEDLDYTLVNEMETRRVTLPEVTSFLAAGKVTLGGAK